MKTELLKVWVLALVLGLYTKTQAQIQTSMDVSFSGIERSVQVYVPEINEGDSAGLIIGLHGMGMTGQDFYNALKPIAEEQGLILASIDGAGDRHDDDLLGDEVHVVSYTIDSLVNRYAVNRSKVYLTGFSYGGREALYYGTTFHELFTGIIPLSAAIQSKQDADNLTPLPWPEPFNYDAVDSLPICNCYSLEDDWFVNEISYFDTVLSIHQAVDTVINSNTLGHTIYYPSFSSDFRSCVQFIDKKQAALTGSTLGVSNIDSHSDFELIPTGIGYQIRLDGFKVVSVFDLLGREVFFSRSQMLRYEEITQGLHFISAQNEQGEIFTQKIFRK